MKGPETAVEKHEAWAQTRAHGERVVASRRQAATTQVPCAMRIVDRRPIYKQQDALRDR